MNVYTGCSVLSNWFHCLFSHSITSEHILTTFMQIYKDFSIDFIILNYLNIIKPNQLNSELCL